MNCIIKSFNPLSLFVGVGDCSDCITMRDERSTMLSRNELTYLIEKLCKE